MKITKSKEWYYWAHMITTGVAWAFCIVPTLVAGYWQLPAIVSTKNETTLTGGAIVVIACCAYPILKGLLKALKSPSAWLILWIVAILTWGLYSISRETLGAMVVIFFTAAIGNSIGAVLFCLSRQFERKWVFCGQITVMNGGV